MTTDPLALQMTVNRIMLGLFLPFENLKTGMTENTAKQLHFKLKIPCHAIMYSRVVERSSPLPRHCNINSTHMLVGSLDQRPGEFAVLDFGEPKQ